MSTLILEDGNLYGTLRNTFKINPLATEPCLQVLLILIPLVEIEMEDFISL
jgi:hypothetical protein